MIKHSFDTGDHYSLGLPTAGALLMRQPLPLRLAREQQVRFIDSGAVTVAQVTAWTRPQQIDNHVRLTARLLRRLARAAFIPPSARQRTLP